MMRQLREGVYAGRQTIAAPDDVMLSVPIPLPLKRALRKRAVEGDTTLAALVRAVLETHVARGRGRGMDERPT